MNRLTIGILAHVDAGKTTLSESMLYLSGIVKKPGRVDYKDSFLDTFELERVRGITIFSKQAVFELGEYQITLLDTPGHVDFSAEMERTLQVLDYAVLVINGADGVQGHTETLWRLLRRYKIPVFLFVNKMDQIGTDKITILTELKKYLSGNCIDFTGSLNYLMEEIATCDEDVLERYIETSQVAEEEIKRLIHERVIFPCYFGSALKLSGIEEFLSGFRQYCQVPQDMQAFGAKIYKISRDERGNRLTHMKITGGSLRVKDLLTNRKQEKAADVWEEKVNEIRIYSGVKYQSVQAAEAGCVCAVTGLSKVRPGEGLGIEAAEYVPVLKPVLTYRLHLPEDCEIHQMLYKLRFLEEEEPLLHIVFHEKSNEIRMQLMGEVQTEIIKSILWERYGVDVEFSSGKIMYKETIGAPVTGAGHFEPLRHYAEVHLKLEPLQAGSGLLFATECSEDVLDRNWQRLILTHLAEREHPGVLTGAPITDMKITLTAGRAHQKHTEGGDFREATYRALRQALRKAESILLEPYYDFTLQVPTDMIGRAMADIERMHGVFQAPVTEGELSVLSGFGPVLHFQNYQNEINAYTGGRGKLFCTQRGYEPCHNALKIIEESGYLPDRDLDSPAGSVFCSHGSGFVVPWDQADSYMHIQPDTDRPRMPRVQSEQSKAPPKKQTVKSSDYWKHEEELEEIFRRTYGDTKKKAGHPPLAIKAEKQETVRKKHPNTPRQEEYLLVDGYNIIFAWEELKQLAKDNLSAARDRLTEILCNYQGYKQCVLILVFDAYRVEGQTETIIKHNNIYVVYTKEAETADLYIEKTVHRIGKKYSITVATSDHLEQVIILGQGGYLLSANGLKEEIKHVKEQIRAEIQQRTKEKNAKEKANNYLFDYLTKEQAEEMEAIRLGKKEEETSGEEFI